MNFQQSNANLEELIKFYLPQDSTVTGVNLSSRFGSVFADVHFMVANEYLEINELIHAKRIMSIRLVKGDGDGGLPIGGFADRS